MCYMQYMWLYNTGTQLSMNRLNEYFCVSQDMGHDFRGDCFGLFTVIKKVVDDFKKTTMMWGNNNMAIESFEVTYRPSLWPRQLGVSLLWFWECALNRALSNRRFACSWRGLRVTSVAEISILSKTENKFYSLLSVMIIQNAMNDFIKCFHVSTAIQNYKRLTTYYIHEHCTNIRLSIWWSCTIIPTNQK